ncbi:mucin-5AC-like [Wyeomyia smithii]|uniref:mucin-5AC-like n=1 Tax=Wyeomyia smithii TaxID=174621 RepID=UPI002467F431|nr:mucin-5AC-like [Wyeomyia smithii]
MTKKKPSPQNRIWEKERRDRLNQTFDSLSKLLPEYEPATQLSKIEILQRTIEYVEKLQDKIKAFLEERDALLKKHVDELEERLQALIARNEDLAALLKKANINVPPCKHGSGGEKEKPEEKLPDSPEVTKSSSKSNKKSSPKKRSKDVEASNEPSVKPSNPATTNVANATTETSLVKSNIPNVIESVSKTIFEPSRTNENGGAAVAVVSTMCSTLPSTCFVMANNQIVGTLKQATGVNVTPALLSTPIMATGVLISNSGSVLQMPLVPQQSSLLIVSNEDVRSKISLKKRCRSSSDSSKAPLKNKISARGAKFSIKSIDVIPGRIVNGKIPIPPLKRAPRPTKKMLKEVRRKRRKRKATDSKESEAKKFKTDNAEPSVALEKSALKVTKSDQSVENKVAGNVEGPVESKQTNTKPLEDQSSSLDMNLDQTDLSNDIFANLQVPDGEPDENQGSLSPTAAYLMNFPLVATGGKIAGTHHTDAPEEDVPDVAEVEKKVSSQQNADNNILLDNFSSYFSSSVYVGSENTVAAPPEPQISSIVTCTSFSTIYQSIDSMLEHKTPRTKTSSDCRYDTTPFTFTLTASTSTTSTAQPSFDYKHSSTSSYYFPTPVSSSKPMDDYCLPKPPIVTEFTFSLTSTTPTVARTVQSQYAINSIYTSTMTTPTYSSYSNQPTSTKSANYTANYISGTATQMESRTTEKYDFFETEKPATSFTFSLTSTTKTLPKYTQASTSSACAIQNIISTTTTLPKTEDCLYKTSRPAAHGHQSLKTPHKQKSSSHLAGSSCNVNYQPQSGSVYPQSKYDVPWMASQDLKPGTSVNQDYNQIIPALDFNSTPTHSYQTNIDLSRKSDIFFAHPTGEENLVTWSPNKLTNILNDTSSPYYPPTTASLPNLNGDLALNTISNGCQSTSTSKSATQSRKGNDSGSTFLSVQQLVDQPRKVTNKNYPNCGNYSTHHKSLHNNYSAEALIASVPGSTSSKKEKYLNDPSFAGYNTYGTEANVATGLSFNFDYSTDYNKNYNYTCQQNYMTSFMDNSYCIPTLPAPNVTSSCSAVTNYSNYGYVADKKQPTSYYQSSSSYHTTSSSDIPYYVPSSEKRTAPMASAKPRKSHKLPVSTNEYVSTLPSTSSSGYFPAILPPPPPTLADDPLCYNNFSFNPGTTTKSAAGSCYNQPYQSRTVPNYSFGAGGVQSFSSSSSLTHGGSNSVSSSSLANFNLSTICPEINEKNATTGGAVAVAVGAAIAGGSGW